MAENITANQAKAIAFARLTKAKYGEGVMGRADTTPTDDIRLPSGSIHLDYALGGGYRVGWAHSLYGEKSGGKTTTAIRALALAQGICRNCFRPAKNIQSAPPPQEILDEDPEARWGATGECTCYAEGLYKPKEPPKEKDEKPKEYKERLLGWGEALRKNSYEEFICAWIDSEGAFDKAWATKIGLDCRRVLYARPTSAEEAIDILHALAMTVAVDMLCIDSIAQLVPSTELTASATEWQQGLQARLVNKAVRKLVSASSYVAGERRSLTQIWINQVRATMVAFGDPTVKPGGKGQEFAVVAEIKFKRGKQEVVTEQYGAKEEVVHIPIKETFEGVVTKNRTAGQKGVHFHYTQRMRDMDAGPAGAVLDEEEIFKLAMHYLVDEDDGTYTLAGTEYKSQKAIKTALHDDAELRSAVRKATLEKMLRSQG